MIRLDKNQARPKKATTTSMTARDAVAPDLDHHAIGAEERALEAGTAVGRHPELETAAALGQKLTRARQ